MRRYRSGRRGPCDAGRDEIAAAWGRIASLIETAKVNSVDPYGWLKATPEAISAGPPTNWLDDVLPWNFPSLSSR